MFPREERRPVDLTQEALGRILTTAGLSAEEEAWSDALFQMLRQAHLTHIGDARGGGMFQHLQGPEVELVRCFER
jgi:hypothetical protein